MSDPERLFGVLNRYERKDSLKTSEIEKALRFKFSAVIPSDPVLVTNSVNKGLPFVFSQRKSKISKCVIALAGSIADKMDQSVFNPTAAQSVAGRG